jgi:hypothetical protein
MAAVADSRRIRRLRRILLASLMLVVALPAGQASAATISGTAFQDADRNAVRGADEAPFAAHQLYLFDSIGSYLGTTTTDAGGHFAFSDLGDGRYRVRYASPTWWELRNDWAPTTTGSLEPERWIDVAGDAVADFGWRPIVRATVAGAPLTRYTGSSGLVAESYNDVLTAREVHDAAVQGSIGAEAASVVIRFGLGTGSTTSTSVAQENGRYTNFRAFVNVDYVSWLDGRDVTLSHEYGHAWSLYRAYVLQQDPTLKTYLDARGIAGDLRLGSSHAWSPRELVAEDYRQLLGSATARAATQENKDLPPAGAVPGLRDFLTGPFSGPVTIEPAPAPQPAPLMVTGVAVSPQPVKTSGMVGFTLSAPASATIGIRDDRGALVRTLRSGWTLPGGSASLKWDRLDAAGRKVRRGTYTAVVDAVDDRAVSVRASVAFQVS